MMAVLIDLESVDLNCEKRTDSMCFYIIVAGELSLFFHSLLLYGAYCETAIPMLPYITVIFTLLLGIVIAFFLVVMFGEMKHFLSKEVLVGAVFLYVIYCYFWLIVYNFYRDLIERTNTSRSTQENTPRDNNGSSNVTATTINQQGDPV